MYVLVRSCASLGAPDVSVSKESTSSKVVKYKGAHVDQRGFWFRAYSSRKVDRIWGIWGSYCNIPQAIFYLLKGDYRDWGLGLRLSVFGCRRG